MKPVWSGAEGLWRVPPNLGRRVHRPVSGHSPPGSMCLAECARPRAQQRFGHGTADFGWAGAGDCRCARGRAHSEAKQIPRARYPGHPVRMPEGARTSLSARLADHFLGGQECPRSFRHTHCAPSRCEIWSEIWSGHAQMGLCMVSMEVKNWTYDEAKERGAGWPQAAQAAARSRSGARATPLPQARLAGPGHHLGDSFYRLSAHAGAGVDAGGLRGAGHRRLLCRDSASARLPGVDDL